MYCKLTNEDGEKEYGDGDVEDWRGDIQKPVWCHGKEPQKEQEEEQTTPVLFHLTERDSSSCIMFQLLNSITDENNDYDRGCQIELH